MNNMKSKEVIVCDADGNVIDQLPSVKETARRYGFAHASILYRIYTGCSKGGIVFRFADPNNPVNENLKRYGNKPVNFDDKLDDKYNILDYKTVNGVCITPCPFKESPKPKVGSAACLKCRQFKGKDKTKHQVACAFSKYRI